jgi:hypothetical protein
VITEQNYGSRWHLRRYLAYHRAKLSDYVLAQTGGDNLEWLDFPFSDKSGRPWYGDREWVGLDFIDDTVVQELWSRFWPRHGNAQNWDAIARLQKDGESEWVLLEAKAHIGELNSFCGAKNEKSLELIRTALTETMKVVGAQKPLNDWLYGHYQYANRLATLHFLNNLCKIPACLVMLYFYGDQHPNANAPASPDGWHKPVAGLDARLGIDLGAPLLRRVHHVFVPVFPALEEQFVIVNEAELAARHNKAAKRLVSG